MSELLVSVILAVCPVSDELSECHEYFVNCAVGKHGKVTNETIKKCLDGYRSNCEGSGCGSQPVKETR